MRNPINDQDKMLLPIGDQRHLLTRRQPQLINVRDAILDIIDWCSGSMSQQNVTASVDAAETVQVYANSDMFRSALLNLCRNAMKSMPTGGELVLTVYADARSIEIEVADSRSEVVTSKDGAITPFSTRHSSKASCDGLDHVVRFIETHGGFMSVQNCPEGGVAFTLHLPTALANRTAA